VGPDAERDADSTKLGAGGSVVLPVSDANRAAIVEATARREITGRDLELDLFAARARLARAREEEDATARALAAHESQVAPAVAAALDAAEKAASAGASDFLPVLLARQRALQASQARIGLRAAHAAAVAHLEAAFGPDPLPAAADLARNGGGR
jgi:outer membrane protein TolC